MLEVVETHTKESNPYSINPVSKITYVDKWNQGKFRFNYFFIYFCFIVCVIVCSLIAVSQITPNNERIQEIPHLVHNHGYLFTFRPAKKVNNFLFYIFIFC